MPYECLKGITVSLLDREEKNPEYSNLIIKNNFCIFLAYDDICIIERLFSSSLTALVSNQAPRKLKVCHFKKGTEICSYSFANTILAVKLNRLVKEYY